MQNPIRTEVVTYNCGNDTCRGFLAAPITAQRVPGVIIAPAWKGLDEFARKRAVALAKLGYVAMAADVYGNGVEAQSDESAYALMQPLFLDRQLLQKRIGAAHQELRSNPLVDTKRIGAIGFCFGGLAALELLRSGVPLCGAVTFHAVLGDQLGDQKALTVPIAPSIQGQILILHGHDDPLVAPEALSLLQAELTSAKIRWQMNIYGLTSHAFTNPEARDIKSGLIYNPIADERSWLSMRNFFEEIFI